MILQCMKIVMFRHNCGFLYYEERTTGVFFRMATTNPPAALHGVKNGDDAVSAGEISETSKIYLKNNLIILKHYEVS